MKGIFISLEGGEGCGKTTIIEELKKRLTDLDVVYTREPGGTKIGEDIRNILLSSGNKEMSPYTEALLYAASRAQHVEEKIKPVLEEGKIVISDRFVDSSLAYQSAGRKLLLNDIISINNFAMQNCIPDIVFFINVSPQIAFERIKERNNLDRLETETQDFHQRIYDYFVSHKDEYWEIDGTKSIDEEVTEIITVIKKYIEFIQNEENNLEKSL